MPGRMAGRVALVTGGGGVTGATPMVDAGRSIL